MPSSEATTNARLRTGPLPARTRAPSATAPAVLALLGILAAAIALTAAGGSASRAGAASPWRQVTDGLWGDSVFDLLFIGNLDTGTRTHLMHSAGFGIFRAGISADEWVPSPANPERPSQTVRALALGRGDPDALTAYAGLQSVPRFARTEDGGQSWTTAPGPVGPSKIDLLESTTTGRIYAAEASGFTLWTSVDQGESWTTHAGVIGPLEPVDDLFAEPADAVIYLRSKGRLYKSIDAPAVWTEVLGPLVTNPMTATMTVEMATAGPRGRLFAVGHLAGARRLAASEDRGASWKAMTWPAGATGEPTALGSGEISFGEVGVWLGLDDGTLWRSADDGRSWELVAELPTSVTTIGVDPHTRSVYAGLDGLGLYRVSPTELQTGAVPAEILSVSAPLYVSDSRVWALARISPVRDDPVGGLRPSLTVFFRSDDGGESWVRQVITNDLGSRLLTSTEFVVDRTFYVGPWTSSDGGFAWRKIGALPGPGSKSPHVIATGPVTITEPTLYGLAEPYADGRGGSGLHYSKDGGASWILADESVSGIVHAAISPGFPSDSMALFVTDRGIVYRTEDTLSFGEVSRVRLIAGQGNVHAFEMAAEFVRDGMLAMSVEDNSSPDRANVYISNDRGNSWELRRDGIDRSVRPRAIAISPNFRADRTIFVGAEGLTVDPPWPSLYASDSAGLDWFAELQLPVPFAVRDLEWAGPSVGGRLFAAAGRAGMWVRELDGGPIGEVLPTSTPRPSTTAPPSSTPGPGTATTPPPSETPDGTPPPTATGEATEPGTPGSETPETPGTPGTPETPEATPTDPIPGGSETPTATESAEPSETATGTATGGPASQTPPTAGPTPLTIYLPHLLRRR